MPHTIIWQAPSSLIISTFIHTYNLSITSIIKIYHKNLHDTLHINLQYKSLKVKRATFSETKWNLILKIHNANFMAKTLSKRGEWHTIKNAIYLKYQAHSVTITVIVTSRNTRIDMCSICRQKHRPLLWTNLKCLFLSGFWKIYVIKFYIYLADLPLC